MTVVPDYTPGEALRALGPNHWHGVQIRRFRILEHVANHQTKLSVFTLKALDLPDNEMVREDIKHLMKINAIQPVNKRQYWKDKSWAVTNIGLAVYHQSKQLMPSIVDMYRREAKT